MRDQEIIQMAQATHQSIAETRDVLNALATEHAVTANVLKGFLSLPFRRRLRWLVLGR
jgi:hypothetical protein